ncbi:hypothetical protein OF83DRAFT_1089062 [Amylostereum chailletii]|nr:hypothetical protein OF83DRAFT_1089062 [Amylostereum chailletii]
MLPPAIAMSATDVSIALNIGPQGSSQSFSPTSGVEARNKALPDEAGGSMEEGSRSTANEVAAPADALPADALPVDALLEDVQILATAMRPQGEQMSGEVAEFQRTVGNAVTTLRAAIRKQAKIHSQSLQTAARNAERHIRASMEKSDRIAVLEDSLRSTKEALERERQKGFKDAQGHHSGLLEGPSRHASNSRTPLDFNRVEIPHRRRLGVEDIPNADVEEDEVARPHKCLWSTMVEEES